MWLQARAIFKRNRDGMKISEALLAVCAKVMGAPPREIAPVGGGDINQACRLDSALGSFFLKFNTLSRGEDMLRVEVQGLALLGRQNVIAVPRVLDHGMTGGFAYLLLEFVEAGPRTRRFWERFGHALAALHRLDQPYFGLPFDNYIGRLPQRNGRHEDFPGFFAECRLAPQLDLARDTGLLDASDLRAAEKLRARLPEYLPAEKPALIHGDLWGGNFIASAGERPVLIDPAPAYAHREMDLAMSRLFGGFNEYFYQAYQESYPLCGDLEERIELYQLYYLLAHVNLFGAAYVPETRRILRRFA
jgi:protein-ribulosamine 3-kinase